MAVLAVGAAVAPPAPAQDKQPWNVSASLRGFYDDNYTTANKNAPGGKLHSFGFEVSPSVSYRLAFDPTVITAGYKYGMRYFEDRASRKVSSADHSHELALKLVHQFPDRYRLEISDNFLVAQEQALLTGVGSGITTAVRSNGNNVRNVADAKFSGEFSPIFGYDVVYNNTFYDYQSQGLNSFSALLDRVEHLAGGNLRWNATESTTALVGYRYGIVDMTSSESINTSLPGVTAPASSRDNTSHYVFLGADHLFTRQLKGSGRLGVQYVDYSKAVPNRATTVSPYADFSGTWTYLPESSLMAGVKHARNATDVSQGALDAESTSIYGQWSHKLTPRMTTSLLGQYQMSTFNQGLNDNRKENLFLAGVNLGYVLIKGRSSVNFEPGSIGAEFKDRLSAEIGYNFDRVDSDVGGRSFTRNRVYIGIRASY